MTTRFQLYRINAVPKIFLANSARTGLTADRGRESLQAQINLESNQRAF
jgi:hypothetical protein